MSGEYQKNHYVPVWYQKRFVPPNAPRNELFYLDQKDCTFVDGRGQVRPKHVRCVGPRECFYGRDLYTTQFGGQRSTDLEKIFFGEIDKRGRRSVDYFGAFEHPSVPENNELEDLLKYMTVQKLRTPKGLGWLSKQFAGHDQDQVLREVVRLQNVYAALWAECVWSIADASTSETKFILSDHPVTVYNRSCKPASSWCRSVDDPDLGFHATQTVFPLSFEKALLLTNLSWVRNPYQNERGVRPNRNPWRSTVFNFLAIQTGRRLAESEVRQINFIIKRRSSRFIAAAQQDWLYPEQHVREEDWPDFGDGYLLMPDPRNVAFTSNTFIGNRSGAVAQFDAYGRRPWQPDYRDQTLHEAEWRSFRRFQGEFARLNGPQRRGQCFELGRVTERDRDEMHQIYLSQEKSRSRRGR